MIQKVKDILNVIIFADIHMTNYHDTPLQVPEKQKKNFAQWKNDILINHKKKSQTSSI